MFSMCRWNLMLFYRALSRDKNVWCSLKIENHYILFSTFQTYKKNFSFSSKIPNIDEKILHTHLWCLICWNWKWFHSTHNAPISSTWYNNGFNHLLQHLPKTSLILFILSQTTCWRVYVYPFEISKISKDIKRYQKYVQNSFFDNTKLKNHCIFNENDQNVLI